MSAVYGCMECAECVLYRRCAKETKRRLAHACRKRERVRSGKESSFYTLQATPHSAVHNWPDGLLHSAPTLSLPSCLQWGRDGQGRHTPLHKNGVPPHYLRNKTKNKLATKHIPNNFLPHFSNKVNSQLTILTYYYNIITKPLQPKQPFSNAP